MLLALAAALGPAATWAFAVEDEVDPQKRRSFKVNVPTGGRTIPITIRGIAGLSIVDIVTPNEKLRRRSLARDQEFEVRPRGFPGSKLILTVEVHSGKVHVTYPSADDTYVPGPLHPNRPRESFVPKGSEEETGEGETENAGQTDRMVDEPTRAMEWLVPRQNRLRSPAGQTTEEAGKTW